MNRANIFICAVVMLFMVSCGGGGASVELSAEMEGFVAEVTNTNSMTKACAKYGYSPDDIPLDLYKLEEPKVTKTSTEGENTCYETSFKHGIAASKVNICWAGGKVASVTSLGFDHSR